MTSDVFRASRGIRAHSARIRTHSRDLRTGWTRWHRTFLALLALPRDDRWLVMCAYCGRIREAGSVWFELPESIVERLHQRNNLLQVSHGACPDCLAVADNQPALYPHRGPAVLKQLP